MRGQTVTLVYLPADPATSTLVDSLDDVKYTLAFILVASTVSGVAVAWRVSRWIHGRSGV